MIALLTEELKRTQAAQLYEMQMQVPGTAAIQHTVASVCKDT